MKVAIVLKKVKANFAAYLPDLPGGVEIREAIDFAFCVVCARTIADS